MNWGPYHPMLSMESKCPIRSAWNPQARPRPQQSVCTGAFNPLENLMRCDFLITLIFGGGRAETLNKICPACLSSLSEARHRNTHCVCAHCLYSNAPAIGVQGTE